MSSADPGVETGAESGSTLPRGLLGIPGRLPFRVGRQGPSEDLGGLVDHFWWTSWDVPVGRQVTARVLPHPTVNLTVEGPSGQDVVMLTGIAHGVFSRTLSGRGDALGLKFGVGAFASISATPIQRLSPHGGPGAALLPAGPELQDRLRGRNRADQVGVLEDYLRDRGRPSEEMIMVRRAAEALIHDPRVGRVAEAADLIGVSERTLQRLFAHWVGVSPGWVLRRGRLHAAAERLIQSAAADRSPAGGQVRTDPGTSLATIAADFGYVDQAHFTNDFRRILGEPPATWAARLVLESAA